MASASGGTSGAASSGRSHDAEVIEAVLQGDVERYGELVERYQLAAWKLALSFVGNPEDAQELAQNGFVKAYRHLRRFRGAAKFSTWLYRIIANECKDFFRARARQPELVTLSVDNADEDSIPFELADHGDDPRDALHARELAAGISRALERLPMSQRTAFVLHHVNGLPLQEVSEVMGCRVGTVKAHLFRATGTLRNLIQPFLKTEVQAP